MSVSSRRNAYFENRFFQKKFTTKFFGQNAPVWNFGLFFAFRLDETQKKNSTPEMWHLRALIYCTRVIRCRIFWGSGWPGWGRQGIFGQLSSCQSLTGAHFRRCGTAALVFCKHRIELLMLRINIVVATVVVGQCCFACCFCCFSCCFACMRACVTLYACLCHTSSFGWNLQQSSCRSH